MGNSSSSSSRGHHDDTVDYGALVPQGVYTGAKDWNQAMVSQLIISRKLAPFYRPLEEYDDSWDDDQILAARKHSPDSDHPEAVARIEHTSQRPKRPGSLKEPARPEAQVYRGAIECPICFLYYPPNINRSRCCDQAICTECFVQIKRSEPTTTHIVSEPAACPYCVQENFGIIYTPPPWRGGLGSEHGGISSDLQRCRSPTDSVPPSHKRRQKSFGADSPEVVLIDHIRPDWESKLEAVRAAVARRANRRIVMRQVGDRLIPVGVTSGRVHALSPEEVAAAAASVENGSRRGRRHRAGADTLEQLMGMTGPDLEELMLMEAMRLSMLEHEEQQRKEAEEKRKLQGTEGSVASLASAGQPNSYGGVGASSLSVLPSSQLSRTTPIHQAGKNSRSISRSRTPPPATPTLPLSAENQAAWRGRTEEPRQFSTLRAALPTTSTAAAVLGAPPRNVMLTSQATVDASNAEVSSVPTTIAQDSVERNRPTAADRSPMYSDAPLPPLPVEAVSSMASSTSTDGQSTSGSTSTSSSFGSLETGTRDGTLGPSPRRSLLTSDVTGLTKPFVVETSTMPVGDVSR